MLVFFVGVFVSELIQDVMVTLTIDLFVRFDFWLVMLVGGFDWLVVQ